MAAVLALHMVLPCRGLAHECMLPQVAPTPIWTDAQSVLFSTAGGNAIRHSPWLLQRLGLLLQAVEDRVVVFKKIKGTANPINSMTKYTAQKEFMRDMRFLSNNPEKEGTSPIADGDDEVEVVGNLRMLMAQITADLLALAA